GSTPLTFLVAPRPRFGAFPSCTSLEGLPAKLLAGPAAFEAGSERPGAVPVSPQPKVTSRAATKVSWPQCRRANLHVRNPLEVPPGTAIREIVAAKTHWRVRRRQEAVRTGLSLRLTDSCILRTPCGPGAIPEPRRSGSVD